VLFVCGRGRPFAQVAAARAAPFLQTLNNAANFTLVTPNLPIHTEGDISVWGRSAEQRHLTVVFQLIYTYALREDIGPIELNKIADSAQHQYKNIGVTGLFLFKDGSILQILEGEQDVVESLYKRISKDPRVSNLLLMIKRHAEKREFPNWLMGFRKAIPRETCFDLTPSNFRAALPKNLSSEIDTICRTFARVNGLI